MGWLRRLIGQERGSIAVMGALSLVGMLGMTSLAVEVGAGYVVKVRNQRVADIAALGAASAYQAAGCSGTVASCSTATATANDIVLANGLPSSLATVSGVTVGSTNGLKVSITTSVPVRIGQILGAGTSYSVTNAAVASLSGAGTAACVSVLGSSGNVISVTGGSSLTASGCAVNANGTIYSDNSSAKVTAKQIGAAAISDSAASWGGNAITTTPAPNNIQIKSNAASDGIKGASSVQTALCYVNKLTSSSDGDYADGNTNCTSQLVTATAQTASGAADWNLSYQPRSAGGIYAYQTGDYSCNYVVPAGSYTIGKLSVSGGCQISFADGSTLKFDSIDMSGSGMTIGTGAVTVVGTFGFNSGSTITIGAGDHNFGTLSVSGGRTLIVGSGNLTVRGAITESGGSTVKVNIGAGNTVTINGDGASAPTAINVGGGSYLCFTSDCSAPTAAGGTFSANGTITTAGGSTLVLPNSATHVINGDLNLNGSSILGAGLYVIKGNFTNNTGGTMTGSNVTFALGGTFTLSGGTSLDLSAPSSSSSYGITDLLIATKSSNGTTIGGGSQDKYGGVIYAPKSALTMTGGSSISGKGSQCLMVILQSISLSGSGALSTSNCASQNSSTGGRPALIQ